MARKGVLYDEEMDRLRNGYMEMMDRKSTQSGSAFGEHYLMVAMLREFGISDKFEASSEVETYIEHLLTYNEKPTVY